MIYRFEARQPDIVATEYYVADSAQVIGSVRIHQDVSVWFSSRNNVRASMVARTNHRNEDGVLRRKAFTQFACLVHDCEKLLSRR